MKFERDLEILEQLQEFNREKHFGIFSGISNLDKIVRFDKKRFNIITSNENQGKTTFANYYCYMMAQTHRYKTLFLSFENDKMQFYSKLQRVYQNNDFVKFSRFLEFDEFKTIADMFAAFDFYLENWHYDILVLDPFESLQIYMMGNYKSEDYASVLERIRQYTKARNIITILSAHQKKITNENDEPSVANIFGSVSFGNKADNIISIRQLKEGVTQVKALKIRHNILEGVKGRSAYFSFNPSNERFEPISEEQAHDYTFEEFAIQAHETQDVGNHTEKDVKELKNENKAYFKQTKVSLYENFMYKNDMSLNDALMMGLAHKRQIDNCRLLKSQGKENEYREQKKKLPSFTIQCTFSGERNKDNMTSYNNVIVVDIDHIQDVERAKEDIKKLPFVLYCAKSVGGCGLFALVRVGGTIQDYKAYWMALKEDFKNIGLQIDESCKDLSRLRFVSYDTEPYINYQATIYNKKKVCVIPSNHYQAPTQTKHNQNKDCVLELQNIMEDVQQNHLQLSRSHSDTLYLSNVLSSLCGEQGRKYLHIIRQQRENYDQVKTDCLFDYSLANNTTKYSIAALLRKYKQAKENSV